MIDPYIITVRDNKVSEKARFSCLESSKSVKNPFEINTFDAITPDEINPFLLKFNVHWDYPFDRTSYCTKINVYKTPYVTKNRDAKIACALSHYALWLKSYQDSVPILILEHDAMFTRQLDDEWINRIMDSPYQFIGINDPIGATRKAKVFDSAIRNSKTKGVIDCPLVDDDYTTIQGLAGGSAYFIKPEGATILLDLIDDLGLWHNDCIISHQVLSGLLGVTTTYFTKIQPNVGSTTV